MEKNTKTQLIEELEEQVINEILSQIKSGEASASHLAVARGILNDNKTLLLMGERSGAAAMEGLAEALPFVDEATHG